MYTEIVNTLKITREFIEEVVKPGDIAVDCTAGNGHDTLQLSKAVGQEGIVYSFDIQEKAILNTKKMLDKNNVSNVKLINDGHENIDKYIKGKVNFIIYNLGYLPGGNKKIITKVKTTIKSLKKSLELLSMNGFLVITSYIGHDGGLEENDAIIELISNLNQSDYNVLKLDFINQINQPPKLYIIEKSRKK